MIGVIRSRDILSHPILTIQDFGWRVFFQSLLKKEKTTFLTLLRNNGCFESEVLAHPTVFQRCQTMELRIKGIYLQFAKTFSGTEPVRRFFESLAEQEQEHADLLQICHFLSYRSTSEESKSFWNDRLPLIEQQVSEFEESSKPICRAEDALLATLQIESSEINHIFVSVVRATDSKFVSKLGIFHNATKMHINYVCQKISILAPRLEKNCENLLVKYSWL